MNCSIHFESFLRDDDGGGGGCGESPRRGESFCCCLDEEETATEEDDDAVDDFGRFDELFAVSVALLFGFDLDVEPEEDLLVVDFFLVASFVAPVLGVVLTNGRFLPEDIETVLSKEDSSVALVGDGESMGTRFRVVRKVGDDCCCCCWRSFWKGEVAPPRRALKVAMLG